VGFPVSGNEARYGDRTIRKAFEGRDTTTQKKIALRLDELLGSTRRVNARNNKRAQLAGRIVGKMEASKSHDCRRQYPRAGRRAIQAHCRQERAVRQLAPGAKLGK